MKLAAELPEVAEHIFLIFPKNGLSDLCELCG